MPPPVYSPVQSEATPESPPALIFSNAALQWLPDHQRLLPRLAAHLAPGGTLAVQMPRMDDRPSHRLIRRLAGEMFPDRFPVDDEGWLSPVAPPAAYHRQANHQISEHFVKISGQFLSWALAPFALGTCFDIFLNFRRRNTFQV